MYMGKRGSPGLSVSSKIGQNICLSDFSCPVFGQEIKGAFP